MQDPLTPAGETGFSTTLAVAVETPEADLREVCYFGCFQGGCEGGLGAFQAFGGMTTDRLAQAFPASVADTSEGDAGQFGL